MTATTPEKAPSTKCRWGEGRYLSPKTAKACRADRNPKRQLCDPHELAFRAARKAATPKPAPAPKVVPIIDRKPPAPKREPVTRAAMVAVEPVVTKTR
jgi:hypothetical protein